MLPLRIRVDLGVMTKKECFAFPRAPGSPSDCLVMYRTLVWAGLTHLQRCSQYIIQHQPTGRGMERNIFRNNPILRNIFRNNPILRNIFRNNPILKNIFRNNPILRNIFWNNPILRNIFRNNPILKNIFWNNPILRNIFWKTPILSK